MKAKDILVSVMERDKIDKYQRIQEENFTVLRLVSRFLDGNSRIIPQAIFKTIGQDEDSYLALLCLAFGLDRNSTKDRVIIENYLARGLMRQDPEVYHKNPYYQNILIPSVKQGRWELKKEFYTPFEGFVYDDYLTIGLREIPRLGYFTEQFDFPSVLQNNNEWMSIMPNEINTLAQPINNAHGKVVTLGLGLGYFAYMAARKNTVESVTVIEKDPNAIELFNKHILPQFECKDKINVICTDAYKYLDKKMKHNQYDYMLADIWRNSYDGAEHYLKLVKYEAKFPNTKFDYWVETSILSRLRWQIFDCLVSNYQKGYWHISLTKPELTISQYLSNEFIHRAAIENEDIFQF